MCNRIRGLKEWSEIPRSLARSLINFEYNPNVAPTEQMPAFLAERGKPLATRMARFGINLASSGGKRRPPLLNARTDSLRRGWEDRPLLSCAPRSVPCYEKVPRCRGGWVMLRIDRAKRTMLRLEPKPLVTAGILERGDLQQMIHNAPAEFFAELGEKLLPLGQEIRPSEVVDDRIDFLALDTDGALVIIELKSARS
jgi:hypothetical protein